MNWSSGFLCRAGQRIFLLTNWHVVSGKNFETKNLISNVADMPGSLNLYFYIGKITEGGIIVARKHAIKVWLYGSLVRNSELGDLLEHPLWVEHPKVTSDIDVVALEITQYFDHGLDKFIFAYDLKEEVNNYEDIQVMDDVFIVGFPLKSSTTPNDFPIYKRGSIASEPDSFKEKPIFYVDGKTKKGMSGSPVLKKKNPRLSLTETHIGVQSREVNLIGIYSGRSRQSNDEYEAELGIVWRLEEAVLPIFSVI